MRSHFNDASVFDQAVFGLMGLGIALNTVLLAVLAVLLFVRYDRTLPRPYLWAVRLGVMLILAGSAEGAVMVVNGAHSIAVADGGTGLPYVNWSTEGGDPRVAHAIGLHGVQVLPLFAFVLGRGWPGLRQRHQLAIVCGFATVYMAVGVALFAQAMNGRPAMAGINPARRGALSHPQAIGRQSRPPGRQTADWPFRSCLRGRRTRRCRCPTAS